MVAPHFVIVVANRGDVYTLSRSQFDVPVIFWYAGYDVVVGEFPLWAYMGILNPDVGVVGRERYLGNRILNEYAGVGFAVVMHNLALVVHQVLQGQGR